uniref:Telomeric repeat-binding factor 2-interacting protein 1 n=1 Tax=Monopterus albus TaxID=43700 RepID=A0A3Q3IZN3_MONAL
MLSKRRHVAKSDISPVLFMTVDGEPMSFFLRPSPNKVKLQPLITAGGGLLCNVQRSGAILLIDPEERAEARTSVYVSTQYIYDCVERGEQLDVEHYRLKPEVVLRHSARLNNTGIYIKIVYLYKSPDVCLQLLLGRAAYTPEEDAAILSYVRNHMTQTGGNRLWQEMEKKCVTSHSWQSMKHRYKTQLAKKLSGVEEVKTIKEKTKVIYLEGVASSISAYWIHCDSIMMKTFALYLIFDLSLMKTSGDIPAALDLLLDPSSVSGPFWNRYDDGLLLSADAVLRQQLQEKYGEESLAKRIVFLELEG